MLSLEQLQAGIVIPIDKPRQWSSFQAVGKVKGAIRRLYGIKNVKIGHAGTLDPLATGLLLVCVGRATKDIERLQGGDKEYGGTIVLGATTPCYDLERPIDRYYPAAHLTRDDVERAAAGLTGNLMQVPPIFSAVKIAGQRAYRYARADAADAADAVIQPKPVVVHRFDITRFTPGSADFTPPPIDDDAPTPQTQLYRHPLGSVPEGLPLADFRIHCGKGTYIRSLARDLGVALDSGAFLASLRRERVGDYNAAHACPVDQIENYLQELQ